jgi:hypothetical protein
MWSPSFVPKPIDWPKQVRVVGTFTQDKKKSSGGVDITKFGSLIDWLNDGNNNNNGDGDNNKPVFIGFGSMVISNTERLSNIIIDAARVTKTRIIVQSSWSKIDVTSEPTLCHGVGPVAHDWLLPQCQAVIHHGTYTLIFMLLSFTLISFYICCYVALSYFISLSLTHTRSHLQTHAIYISQHKTKIKQNKQVEQERLLQDYDMDCQILSVHSLVINICGVQWSIVQVLDRNLAL